MSCQGSSRRAFALSMLLATVTSIALGRGVHDVEARLRAPSHLAPQLYESSEDRYALHGKTPSVMNIVPSVHTHNHHAMHL